MSESSARVITDEHRQYAASALHGLPFSKHIGMKLVGLELDTAVIKLDYREDLLQPSGILHGGVTATLIDTAMAFAVRTRLPLDAATATVDLTIHYMRPLTRGSAVCTAKVLRAGKRFFTVTAEVVNDEGKMIATGISTYTKV